jgi:methylated-DNA-[protein]-cysteine S-methyltransferase
MGQRARLGEVAVAAVASRFGPVNVAVSGAGLVAVEIGSEAGIFRSSLVRRGWDPILDARGASARLSQGLASACREIAEYLEGRRTGFTVPVDLLASSAWDRRVLAGVCQVPFGHTISYGELARLVDAPGAARAAGGAVGRNPVGLVIPCHRVIAGDGTIGGYGGSWVGEREANVALKRALLGHEGVTFAVSGGRRARCRKAGIHGNHEGLG